MHAQAQTTSGHLRLQLPESLLRAERDDGYPSLTSNPELSHTTYHTFLDTDPDDEPTDELYQPVRLHEAGLSPNTSETEHRDAVQPVWPPPRKESLMNHSPTPWVCYPAFRAIIRTSDCKRTDG